MCGGSDDVAGINSAKRDAVDFEWTGDEEHTLIKGFEKNDALASEAASEKDKNGSRLQRCPKLRGTNRFADLSSNCKLVRVSKEYALVNEVFTRCQNAEIK